MIKRLPFMGASSPPWQQTARAKREETNGKIPDDWRLKKDTIDQAKSIRTIAGTFIEEQLDRLTVKITSQEAQELVREITTGKWSAEAVTLAFCKRAAAAQQLNNCLIEIFFAQAQERARELDRHMAETGSPVGPLHGLPISLKDQFHVSGVETSMGYVGWIGTFEGRKDTGKEKRTNSLLVDELLALGAVLYCKTNLPQTLLLGETLNNIMGTTLNPVNQNLSCGGSSGGEGALLALRGSCLGVGTDVGGSVRILAAFCSVCSLKPSVARTSYKDVANSVPGQMTVSSSVGFMSTSLLSIRFLLKSILSTRPWELDPEVVPIPWRHDQEQLGDSPLCFGIFATDNIVTPHPPIARGINLVCQAIEKAGHTSIPWQPPPHEPGSVLDEKFIYSDGGADVFKQLSLSGEPLIPPMKASLGEKPKPPIPYLEFQQLCLERKAFRARYTEYWTSTSKFTGTGRPVDALIMPVAPHAGVIPGKMYHYSYTDILNFLDYTSVCIPVTHADKTVDIFDRKYRPLNDTDRQNWKAYDAEIYDGAPVGVQIVGRSLQEERILAIAETLQEALSAVRFR